MKKDKARYWFHKDKIDLKMFLRFFRLIKKFPIFYWWWGGDNFSKHFPLVLILFNLFQVYCYYPSTGFGKDYHQVLRRYLSLYRRYSRIRLILDMCCRSFSTIIEDLSFYPQYSRSQTNQVAKIITYLMSYVEIL